MAFPIVAVAIMVALTAASMAASYYMSRSKKQRLKPSEMEMQTSQYGIAIPVLYGRPEPLPGNLIWFGNFRTIKKKVKGGKGGGSSGSTYTYSISLAFGICLKGDKDITLVNGFAEKKVLSADKYTFYDGTQTAPDPHIQSIMTEQGKTRFPVWKGLVYVVLDNYDLESSTFIPQFTWELQQGMSFTKYIEDGGNEWFEYVARVVSEDDEPGTGEGEPEEVETTYTKDTPPPLVIKDILTNDFYGCGLSEDVIDSAAIGKTVDYCVDKDLLVAMAFTNQQSVLDAVSYVMAHHNGFVTYRDGEIFLQQMEMTSADTQQSASNSLTEADFVKRDDQLPIRIERKGGRDYKNKILVEFLDRKEEITTGENRYQLALAQAEDAVDIDAYGMKEDTIRLDGLKKPSRALYMAWIYLRQILFNPRVFEFELGIKNWGFYPGKVIYLTSNIGVTNQPARIMELIENNGLLKVVASEESTSMYNDPPSISYSTTPSSSPDLRQDAGDVIRPMIVEVPARYSTAYMLAAIVFSPSAVGSWFGASLYRSYLEAGTYSFIESTEQDCITGLVIDVGNTSAATAYIDIEVDSDEELESIDDDSEYFQGETKNLLMIRTPSGEDIFIRYQTVELLSARNWRLTGLIYDTVNFPVWNSYGSIEASSSASPYEIAFYGLAPYNMDLISHDIDKTLYIKAASYNHVRVEQDLADVESFSRVIEGLNVKPLAPFGVEVNNVSLSSNNSVTTGAGDIVIVWKSRNRKNSGGNNFTRSDAINDDDDFSGFELEIYSGADLLRTITTTSKTTTYSSAQQASDGGSSPYNMKLRQVATTGYESNDLEFTVNLV